MGGPQSGSGREGSPPGLLNGSMCGPYSLSQCSPSEFSALRNATVQHHPHMGMGTPPGGLPPHHPAAFSQHPGGLAGLNEFLWSTASLGGIPHGAPGLFTGPSFLSAFPGLAGWSPKSAAAPAPQHHLPASIIAQYMAMASNPPVFPFDLSSKSAASERCLNLSPSSQRSRRSDSMSPPSHSSMEFSSTEQMNSDNRRRGSSGSSGGDGKMSPSLGDDEAIDLVKGSPRIKSGADNSGGYGLTFHGKISSAGEKQESISILRERAAKQLANGHNSPTVKN